MPKKKTVDNEGITSKEINPEDIAVEAEFEKKSENEMLGSELPDIPEVDNQQTEYEKTEKVIGDLPDLPDELNQKSIETTENEPQVVSPALDESSLSELIDAANAAHDDKSEDSVFVADINNAHINEELETTESQEEIEKIARSVGGVKAGKRFVATSLPNFYTKKEQQKWADLHGFRAKRTPLYAMIIKSISSSTATAAVVQIAGYEEFKIIVPYSYMDIKVTNRNPPVSEQRLLIENRIGAKIPIVITELDYESGNGTGVGNCVIANALLRRRYFYRGVRDNLSQKTRKVIQAGSRVDNVYITRIISSGILVNLYGVNDVLIPKKELSHLYISHPKNHFSVGQCINVKILGVELAHDEAYNVKVDASVKALTENNTEVALSEATINELCLATVTTVGYETGSIFVATKTGYNARVTTVMGNQSVKVGSLVKFRLYKKEGINGSGVITDVISYNGES